MRPIYLKKDYIIYLYYSVLLLLLVSRPIGATAPHLALRLGFLIAMTIPATMCKDSWLPAVMTCFISVGQYGFAYSYLPSGVYYYSVVLLLSIALYGKRNNHFKIPIVLFLILLDYLFVDLFCSARFGQAFWGLLVVILICFFIQNNRLAEKRISMAFVISSFTLSLMYILFRDKFLVDYSYMSGLERADWIDPNYFSMVINMGAIVALTKVYDRNLSLLLKIFYITTIAMSFMAVALLASRGGLLAFCVAAMIIVVFSNGKNLTKAFVAIAIVVFAIYLFNNQYFELVQYRFENDTEGGSGRLGIWQDKLKVWVNGGIFSMLFGFGSEKSASLSGTYIGFHNDFLAELVTYGFVGFCLFISLWITPIKNAVRSKQNIVLVIAFMTFMTVECCTLEPLTLGRIPFWMFFIYILMVSKIKDEDQDNLQTN